MTIRQAIRPADQIHYKFHTYAPAGRDRVISVWAEDQSTAWAIFDMVYGKETPVDSVTVATK